MRLYADGGRQYRALTPSARHYYGLFLIISILLHLLIFYFLQKSDFHRPSPPPAEPEQQVELVNPETLAPPVKKQKEILFGTDQPEELKKIPLKKETNLPPVPKSLNPAPTAEAPAEKTLPSRPTPTPPTPASPPQSRPAAPPSPPQSQPAAPPPPPASNPEMAERPQTTAPSLPDSSLPATEQTPPASKPAPPAGMPGLPFADEKNLDRLAKVFSDSERKPKDAISLNTDDLKYFSYLLKVKNKIEYIWKYPSTASERGMEGDLLLTFTIHRDGRVSDVLVASSSGFDLLDRAAAAAVQSASPFPPLPDSWNEEQITITGHFLYFNRYNYLR